MSRLFADDTIKQKNNDELLEIIAINLEPRQFFRVMNGSGNFACALDARLTSIHLFSSTLREEIMSSSDAAATALQQLYASLTEGEGITVSLGGDQWPSVLPPAPSVPGSRPCLASIRALTGLLSPAGPFIQGMVTLQRLAAFLESVNIAVADEQVRLSQALSASSSCSHPLCPALPRHLLTRPCPFPSALRSWWTSWTTLRTARGTPWTTSSSSASTT